MVRDPSHSPSFSADVNHFSVRKLSQNLITGPIPSRLGEVVQLSTMYALHTFPPLPQPLCLIETSVKMN